MTSAAPPPTGPVRLTTARANPLAGNPLRDRDDLARAVIDLYEPLLPYVSAGGARVRLGSFASVFEESTAELEGFSRPLYGIVPMVVGGGRFPHWGRFVSGLESGTDPDSPEYWGPVRGDGDQRMVEQAAIGLALAFCPDRLWEPLDPSARDHLVGWLRGIFTHAPASNNWQFFRVLVSLGLERVGATFDTSKVDESLDLLDSYRIGHHWYADGALRNVDWYVPFAFHTYGLLYAAANDLGLGDDSRAEAFRERAAAFAPDLVHWFDTNGAAVPFGRSMTYRFAMASFWSALAWADVRTDVSWGAVRGLLLRHLRWWCDKPISDRDGVLSIGFTYDNRRLQETYSSAGSPYWCMKAFGALAAPATHPIWTSPEEELEPLAAPVTLVDAGQVIVRGDGHSVLFPARTAPAIDFPEQSSGKYRKFAYSSVFGFSGDVADTMGSVHTDSMLALTDAEGNRRTRLGVESAGVVDAMAWSTWRPWPDVRVDTVCWVTETAWHGRVHRVRTRRPLATMETGFAVGLDGPDEFLTALTVSPLPSASLRTSAGCSAIFGLATGPLRRGVGRTLAVNANLVTNRPAVPALAGDLVAGDHLLACRVFASPDDSVTPDVSVTPDDSGSPVVSVTPDDSGSPVDSVTHHSVTGAVPDAVMSVLDRIAAAALPSGTAADVGASS